MISTKMWSLFARSCSQSLTQGLHMVVKRLSGEAEDGSQPLATVGHAGVSVSSSA